MHEEDKQIDAWYNLSNYVTWKNYHTIVHSSQYAYFKELQNYNLWWRQPIFYPLDRNNPKVIKITNSVSQYISRCQNFFSFTVFSHENTHLTGQKGMAEDHLLFLSTTLIIEVIKRRKNNSEKQPRFSN